MRAAPYDEIWTANRCRDNFDPVLADGGELILFAPHISTFSQAHGRMIAAVGYHCRDYFLKPWDRFKHLPWGVPAHSKQVHGLGTYENGIGRPRARVTLGHIPDPRRPVERASARPRDVGHSHKRQRMISSVQLSAPSARQSANIPNETGRRWA